MKRNTLHIIIMAIALTAALMAPQARAKAQQSVHDMDIAVLGDSNTSIGGDSCTIEKGWTCWFQRTVQPHTIRSYARSGATWTNTRNTHLDTEGYTEVLADNNVVYNQAERLVKAYRQGTQPAPHLIIIAAGTNDAWFKRQRQALFQKSAADAFEQTIRQLTARKPSEVLTLAESVRYTVELLLDAFPQARIILLTPMQTVKAPYADTQRVGDIIEAVGQRMSLPVVRQDHITGIYREREAQKPHLTTDGTHTSTEGARRNGILLAKTLEQLM